MKGYKLWVVIITLWLAAPAGAFLIIDPSPAFHVPASVCPAGDGWNHLNPDPVTYLPGASVGLMHELLFGDWDYSNYSYSIGGPLNGWLSVDVYESRFVGTHNSGGEILARYQKGPGDPDNLQWIQLVDTSDPLDPPGPLGPPSSPYIDPYPNDDPEANQATRSGGAPFYYNWTETQTPITDYGQFDLYNNANMFGAYDLLFYDFSTRYHPPVSYVSWTGDLYLASVDGFNITIYDGIRWGWEASCVPEPASLVVLALGVSLLVRRRETKVRVRHHVGEKG